MDGAPSRAKTSQLQARLAAAEGEVRLCTASFLLHPVCMQQVAALTFQLGLYKNEGNDPSTQEARVCAHRCA